ncbi:MAG: extracellular solute-binding protein [Calditrichaeota bacterium]|nr:extracellular solute-binding protein [Calditrichota bacterium]
MTFDEFFSHKLHYFKKLISLISIFSLMFCLNCQSRKSGQGEQITLTYWSANNQYEINLAEELVAEWEKIHPNVHIKHQPIPEGRSSEEVVLAAVVGKTTPDIYSNMWPGDIELYVRADALLQLDTFANFDSFATSRYSEDVFQQSKSKDGHVYQILWKTNPIMMAYNKNIFREAGFEKPPKTFEEYLKAAKKITRDRDGDGYIDRWIGITQILVTWWQRFFDFYPLYIAASGGRTLIENGNIVFDNQAAVDVFRFLKTLFDKGYFPRERMDARADVFINEIVASRFTGPWAITQIEKYKPEGFEYDFVPVPRPSYSEGPAFTYGDYKSIVIFKNTKHPKWSWEFAKFLVSRHADLLLLETADQLPLRKNILQDSLFAPYFKTHPRKVVFAEQARYVRGADSSPVLREIFDAISKEFEASVIYGVKSPEQAVHDAAERARLIME